VEAKRRERWRDWRSWGFREARREERAD